MNRETRRMQILTILTILMLVYLISFKGAQAASMNAVYIQSNHSEENEVALLTQAENDEPLEYVTSYYTGGKGDPKINGNQAHAIASDGRHLFVANAGDDSITTFRIARSGRLSKLTKLSSMGRHPVSLAVVRNNLIVLNQGENDTSSQINPNIRRFRITPDGELMMLKGKYEYLPSDSPVDVVGNIKSDTFHLVISGLGQIDTFHLESGGSISRVASVSQVNKPLGAAMGRLNSKKLAVTLADSSLPGVESVLFNLKGMPLRIFQNIQPHLIDPCWAVADSGANWLWTSSFETRKISLFRWEGNGNITFVSDSSLETEGPGGIDLTISQNNKSLFWLRVDDVNDDTKQIRPYVETFSVNVRSYSGSAGLSLINKTWLPESWSYAQPTGILSIQVRK